MGRQGERDRDFTTFVRTRSARLLHIAHMMCGDLGRAEDITQVALEKAYVRWDKIEADDPFAYVRQIVVNEYRNRLRRRPWCEQPADDVVELGDDLAATGRQNGADPSTLVGDQLEFIRLLEALTPRERSVLALRFADDLTLEQIADVLGVSVGAVKSTNFKALEKLRCPPELVEPAVGGRS